MTTTAISESQDIFLQWEKRKILPSERAFAYKMLLEPLKRQGKRRDLEELVTYTDLWRSDKIIAKSLGTSRSQVQRYIRLTFLIPELLEAVDNKIISFTHAVNISYLREAEQKILHEIISDQKFKLSSLQSERLKSESAKRKLNHAAIYNILKNDKDYVSSIKNVKIPFQSIAAYFPEGDLLGEQEIVCSITNILEQYFRDNGPIGKVESNERLSEPKPEAESNKEAVG